MSDYLEYFIRSIENRCPKFVNLLIGEGLGLFEIASDSGTLSHVCHPNGTIDREILDNYRLTVGVVDTAGHKVLQDALLNK